MKQVLKKDEFTITYDQSFLEVISSCQSIKREGQYGTWITSDIIEAYYQLHQMGYAHSVEVWKEEKLVGGLYGVAIGTCFYGESMFTKVSNASKAGFITLVKQLATKGFTLIDCQVYTQHLESLGAHYMPRQQFVKKLEGCLTNTTLKGNWGELL